MKEIGFGIVGTGSIASRFARACAMVPGVCAAGISSRSAENGRKFAAENGVDRVYENPTYMSRRRTRFITKTAWRRFEQANRF